MKYLVIASVVQYNKYMKKERNHQTEVFMQDESQEKILYRKIADALLLDLHENPVALSKHFPCIREIQEKFHCSSYTAHRALKLLNQRGVLQVHHGKRSSPVYFPRKIGGSKGMILIVFPDWNQLRGHSFAADFVLGASTALAEENYAAFPCPCASWAWLHGNPEMNQRVLEALHDPQYQGVIWANPTLNETAILAQLEQSGIPLVCALRSHNGLSSPCTTEDFRDAFTEMVSCWKRLHLKRIAVHAPYSADHTYIPQLRQLVRLAGEAEIRIDDKCILGRIDEGNSFETQCCLLKAFLSQKPEFDALFSFSPEIFSVFRSLKGKNEIDPQLKFGCLSKQTIDITGADWIIESVIAEHGRAAAHLLASYLQSGEKPENCYVPAILKTKQFLLRTEGMCECF